MLRVVCLSQVHGTEAHCCCEVTVALHSTLMLLSCDVFVCVVVYSLLVVLPIVVCGACVHCVC